MSAPPEQAPEGILDTAVGPVPRVSSTLKFRDRVGASKVRWNINRMDYRVAPGLYALDSPDEQSPVLATANFKLSFDRLRSALPGRSAWILVLDTNGVNVWCAAGRGLFGTEELVRRIQSTRLADLVAHRQVVLPQLAGPGVAAHELPQLSGFTAVYGPVRAEDLPAFLDTGCVAHRSQRRKEFRLRERLSLAPVELISALRYALPIGLVLLLVSGLGWPGEYRDNVSAHGWLAVSGLGVAVLGGSVLTLAVLPWLPGRAFALKGAIVGLVLATLHAAWWLPARPSLADCLEVGGCAMLQVSVAAFLALNLTGVSTYTSLSGVRKEMRWAIPQLIGLAAVGLPLWLVSRFLA